MAFDPMMGALGGIGGGFGGGMMNSLFPDASKQAMPYLNQIPGQQHQAYDPYITNGLAQMGGLKNIYNQMMANPNDIISRIGSGYQQSPGYQWQLGQGEQAINNAAGAGGMMGTPQHQQQAGQLASNLANQDYDQYLQHALGIFGGGIAGKQGLFNTGYNASNEMATNLAQALMSQANLAYAGQNNKNQQTGGLIGNILGMFSGGGSGGGGGGFFGF